MKKYVVVFAFVMAAALFSTQSSAQDNPVLAGFKAGTSLSNYRLGGDMKGFKSKMNIGGSVGGFIKYDISTNFALQSGIDVYYKISELESREDKSSDKLKSWGVEVPLYGIMQFESGDGKVFIGAGPYIGYGINSKSNRVNLFRKNNETGKAMNRLDYGVGGIIGYDFTQNWQINASYQFGLADLHKGMGGSMKSHGAALGIVYKF